MKDGICPKCASKEILRFENRKQVRGTPVIRLGLLQRPVSLTRLVCASCGYVEEWVLDRDDLERLGEARRSGSA